MGRLVLAGVLLAASFGVALAKPTRKVTIETDPPGATVYLETVDSGAKCESTPCTFEAPIGESTIIIRLDKYEPAIEPLDVPKGKRPLVNKFKLKGAFGTIVVDSPKGASVRVDDEDKGTAPVNVEVTPEAHRVVVMHKGKMLFDDFVEVELNVETPIKYKLSGATTTVAEAGDGDGDRDGDGDGDGDTGSSGDGDSGGAITTTAPTGKRAPYLSVGVAFDVGFRRFDYQEPAAGVIPFEEDGGAVLIGPAVELWPGRMLGLRLLRGLSLFARVQFGVNRQPVTKLNSMNMEEKVGAETFYGLIEVSLRHKWIIGDKVGLEASGGFARDQVEFNADSEMVLLQVPSADYRSIRLGVRASLIGTFEPFISLENRIVLSGGNLATRVDNSDTSGFRAAAGVMTKVGVFGLKLEGSYARYSWTFSNDSTTAPPATGATDQLKLISLQLGYQY